MQHTVATAGAAVTVAVEPHEHLFYQGKEIQENFVRAGDQRISRLTLNLKSSIARNPTDFSKWLLSTRVGSCVFI